MNICDIRFSNAHLSHSYSQTPDASHFERHCHSGYELLYVVCGRGEFIIEGSRYPMEDNTLVLLRPWEYHYVCPQSRAPYERIVISFDASVPIDAAARTAILGGSGTGRRGVYFSAETMPDMLPAVFKLAEQPCGTPAERETLLRTSITQALLLLSAADSAEGAAVSNSLVLEVIDYINKNLKQNMTLEGLSRRFFVSKYYLCRLFRRYTGMSVFTYINTKRVALARQLQSGGMSSESAATAAGFREYSSFYRACKKQTGLSPSEARTRDGK